MVWSLALTCLLLLAAVIGFARLHRKALRTWVAFSQLFYQAIAELHHDRRLVYLQRADERLPWLVPGPGRRFSPPRPGPSLDADKLLGEILELNKKT